MIRELAIVLIVGCGGGSSPALKNSVPPEDPLAKLRTWETQVCACNAVEGETLDETCSSEAVKPLNDWVHDGTSWKKNLDDAQIKEALEIADRIRRCFQAGIGDPLPPHH
ncbi:MAG TPA: hypothetical protein VF403_19660 [Kofleriaceae bacterium]